MEAREVIAGLIAGDEAAWRRFVREQGGLIHAVAFSFGLSDADREDLFQSACLAAVRSITTLRDPTRLSSWVYTLTYRLAIDTHRKGRELPLSDLPDPNVPMEALRLEPTVAEDLVRLEEIARLRDAIGLLDPRCRRLLEALYLEDPPPSYLEISGRDGIPVGSIGPTRARCLAKVRILLEELSNASLRPSTNRTPEAREKPGETRTDPAGRRRSRT